VGTDPSIKVWDAQKRLVMAEYPGRDVKIPGVVWSPDGSKLLTVNQLASVGDDWGDMLIWDAVSLKLLGTAAGHTHMISGARFSPRGNHFASIGYDGTVRVWDANTFVPIAVLREHRERVMWMDYSPDGKYLATARLASGPFARGKDVIIWDTDTLKPVRKWDLNYDSSIRFVLDGRKLLLLTGDKYHLHLWDPLTGRHLGKRGKNHKLSMATFSRDGKYAITMDYENPSNQVLYIWRRKVGNGE